MNVITASNPVWSNAENTAIDLLVQFDTFSTLIPFTANPADITPYGREIFARAVAGEFGPIAPYIPPPPPPSPTTDGQNSPQVIR